ncbi:flavin reductase [uncultured Caballeronia sp.]|uniref:flavin reductase family protein n=1 Tax=uncultured Caballeronia sp. TaxID=1827198 RepID=UPI0015773E8B
MDTQDYRNFFGQLPTGVTAIVAKASSGPVGLVVGTFSSVSLDPPLISFMVTKGSRSWAAVRAEGRFTANILASDQRRLSQTLSGWSVDKFRNVMFDEGKAHILRGCLAWADCIFEREVEAGDHTIVLATPCELAVERDTKPLVFFQRAYHRTLSVEDGRGPGWV